MCVGGEKKRDEEIWREGEGKGRRRKEGSLEARCEEMQGSRGALEPT